MLLVAAGGGKRREKERRRSGCKDEKEEDISSLVFDDFDDEIIRLMQKGHIPSLTLCYIKNDEIVFSNA